MYKSVPLSILTDVEDAVVPGKFELSQNYPNPFNPTTSISYSIPARSDVSIKVYNNIGQLVTTLVNELMKLEVIKLIGMLQVLHLVCISILSMLVISHLLKK